MSFWTDLFSDKHTVTVSSTVYNLAGDEASRPNFLNTTIVGAVLGSSDLSIGNQINNSYLTGPGLRIKSFARWAQDFGYSTFVGMRATSIQLVSAVDFTVIVPFLPTLVGATTVVRDARVGNADFVFWVIQYMQLNYPTLISTDYTCDFDPTTNTVTITFVDTTTASFVISDFDLTAQYLYVEYVFDTPGTLPAPDVISDPMYFVYKQNTGNSTLDTLFIASTTGSYFLPYIPLRIKKTMISPTYWPSVYTESVVAVKKAIGASFDDLINKLNSSTSVADIDYAYIVFGVSLNVKENACRAYIYEFFLDIMLGIGSTGSYTNYSVNTNSNGFAVMNFNMTIYWSNITETFGTGTLTNDLGVIAKAGEFWFDSTNDPVRLYWQVTDTTYRYLDITGLQHVNMIYGGNAVSIMATEALASTTESGFIIPLNQGIYEATSLVNATQMATACCLLVCNAYTINTTPWYQSDWFKVLLIVAVIAITALTADPATLGLLGSNLSVGTALGFTATSAVVVGAVTNSVAAIILVTMIQTGSTAILGKQFGAIVGAILSLVTLQVGTALMNGTTATTLLNTLTQPMNLLKLSEAAGNGYAQFMQAGADNINKSTNQLISDYNMATTDLKTKSQEVFGIGSGVDLTINPLALTDVTLTDVRKNIVIAESPQSFLDRTLITGSDIVDLSLNFVTNFCDATLNVDLKQT